MDLQQIEQFAVETIAELAEQYPRLEGYTFEWCNTKNALGRCSYKKVFGQWVGGTIQLSKPLVKAVKDQETIIDTILHEIAHAIAGREAGHGYKWQAVALSIGCNAKRCYSASEIDHTAVSFKYTHTCESCGAQGGHSRRWKRGKLCGVCYRKGERNRLIETQNY